MIKLTTSYIFAGLLCVSLVGCSGQPTTSTEVTSVKSSTALMDAAAAGNLNQVMSLLAAGEPVNAVSPVGTALTRAVAADHIDVAYALLRAGADPNLGVSEGQSSPLHHLTAEGDLQAIRTLIAAGAELDQKDENGLTPIAIAADNGNLPVAKTLIKAGANVNIVMRGRSLLMHVVEQNSLLMAQVLIQAGADVNFEADDGNTALKIAKGHRFGDLEMLLIQSGARS